MHRKPNAIIIAQVFSSIYMAACARIASADQTTTNEDEQAIRQLEARLNAAVAEADAELFDHLFADEFTHTSHSGRFRNKAQWMADLRRGGTKYSSFKTDDLAVRIYGDTAVVTGRSLPAGTNSRGDPIQGQYRYLRVWHRRDKGWQVVAFQGTRIAEAQSGNSKEPK